MNTLRKKAKALKSPQQEALEKQIDDLMTNAATLPDLMDRQRARAKAYELKKQLSLIHRDATVNKSRGEQR
jgi:hypothetical protein